MTRSWQTTAQQHLLAALKITDLLNPDQTAHNSIDLGRLNAPGEVFRVEQKMQRKDQRVITVEISLKMLADGRVQAIGRDISRRKAADEEIRRLNENLEQRVRERTAQLKEANSQLEAFVYMVSHDLKQPLSFVNDLTGLFRQQAGPSFDGPAQHTLEVISGMLRHSTSLVDDLLVFSHAHRGCMDRGEVHMKALVCEVLKMLEASETANRAITWKITELPPVRGDQAMLRQVWQNLLSNAIKYSSKREDPWIEVGSTVRVQNEGRANNPGEPSAFVSAGASGFQDDEKGAFFDSPLGQTRGIRNEESGLDANGIGIEPASSSAEIVFYVRDNGEGFDMSKRGQLFQAFSRLHHSSEFPGTGVGLAAVQQIVRRHGGRVWGEGEVGKGATFYFSLPLSSTEK